MRVPTKHGAPLMISESTLMTLGYMPAPYSAVRSIRCLLPRITADIGQQFVKLGELSDH